MPFTEIIVPSIKPDLSSQHSFQTTFPSLARDFLVKHGILEAFTGFTVLDNENDVSSDFRYLMVLEWNVKEDFQAFISSKDMMSFARYIIPLVTEPPRPQLYETSVRPREVFSAPFTEVLRLHLQDESKVAEAQESWKTFSDAVISREPTVKISTGLSVNLPEKMLVGIIGWGNLDTRQKILGDEEVVKAKAGLAVLGELGPFVAKMERLEYPEGGSLDGN